MNFWKRYCHVQMRVISLEGMGAAATRVSRMPWGEIVSTGWGVTEATETALTDEGFLLRYRGQQLVGITILDASTRFV